MEVAQTASRCGAQTVQGSQRGAVAYFSPPPRSHLYPNLYIWVCRTKGVRPGRWWLGRSIGSDDSIHRQFRKNGEANGKGRMAIPESCHWRTFAEYLSSHHYGTL